MEYMSGKYLKHLRYPYAAAKAVIDMHAGRIDVHTLGTFGGLRLLYCVGILYVDLLPTAVTSSRFLS